MRKNGALPELLALPDGVVVLYEDGSYRKPVLNACDDNFIHRCPPKSSSSRQICGPLPPFSTTDL